MVIIVVFTTVAINYYLISFAAVTFDKPFLNISCSSMAEALAYVTSGILFSFLGPKISLMSQMSLSAVTGLLLLLVGWVIPSTEGNQGIFFTVLVMLCKFGISGSYNL